MSEAISELGVKSIVLDEMNIHSKLINDNLKQNLIVQKRDYEGMIKKLGSNLQEALVKIKGDVQFEYKDLFTQLEQKINTAV